MDAQGHQKHAGDDDALADFKKCVHVCASVFYIWFALNKKALIRYRTSASTSHTIKEVCHPVSRSA